MQQDVITTLKHDISSITKLYSYFNW